MAYPILMRESEQLYRLIGQRCKSCGKIIFPKRKICPECGSTQLEDFQLKRRGKVYSYTIQYAVPTGFKPPVIMAVVELDGGGAIIAQLTECKPEEVKIGMDVEIILRKIYERGRFSVGEESSLPFYYFKARPVRLKM